jgi:hypothetical protein
MDSHETLENDSGLAELPSLKESLVMSAGLEELPSQLTRQGFTRM